MGLVTPERVQKLQRALHAKAKQSPGYRFYSLYDKVCRQDILSHAYALCRANGGAAGVDGQGFTEIEAYGRERWLGELSQALNERTYRPAAVRRVYIPKPDGKQRPPEGEASSGNPNGSRPGGTDGCGAGAGADH